MKRIIVAALAVAAVLAACTGPQGPAGEMGPAGEQGEGAVGPVGPVGPQGASGTNGTNGTPGTNGTSGTNGTNGRSSFVTSPGIKLRVLGANTSLADGTTTADFLITDPSNVPLDISGLYTEGPVTVRLILASMPVDSNGKALQYVAYTTRVVVSPINDAGIPMANTDTGGTFAELNVSQGTYRYTFAAKALPANAGLVHTVAATATRTMKDGTRYVGNATFNYVPAGNPADAGVTDGGSLPSPREAVTTQACNQCHNVLKAHGGNRRDTAVCITCHTPQSTDPLTLRTVDFKVMIHKIHMGFKLPSVLDGGTYGIQHSDWSTVEFPQDPGNCAVCHTGGPDTNRWMTTPSRAACTSCHDDVVFELPVTTGHKLHSGGELLADEPCGPACHGGTTGLAPIATKHTTIRRSATRPEPQLTIDSITNTAPGQTPVLNFTVKVNGTPRDITTAPMNSLAATIAGPSTDIASFWSATIQGTGATGTLTAVDAANGKFSYTFPAAAAIPSAALGSYGVGMEGYITDTATGERLTALNPVVWFPVTDATAKPRRKSVDLAKCDTCHLELNGHGYQRKNTEYCVFCHNPNKTNSTRIAQVEGQTVVAHSVNFKDLIHNIHTGEDHVVKPYVLGAYPPPSVANPQGTPKDFSEEVRFPGDRRVCTTCHVSQAVVNLPLPPGVLPSNEETLTCTEDAAADTDSFCQAPNFVSLSRAPVPPQTAACISCHDDPAVKTHAQLNTTAAGAEACSVCHAIGEVEGLDLVHKPIP